MKHSEIIENDPDFDPDFRPVLDGRYLETNRFCAYMHLFSLLGFVGVLVVILMWAPNKKKSKIIDLDGKNILNWMISLFIYSSLSGILICLNVAVFFLIGCFILFSFVFMTVIFAIIGAIKANNKEIFKYPLTITFIK